MRRDEVSLHLVGHRRGAPRAARAARGPRRRRRRALARSSTPPSLHALAWRPGRARGRRRRSTRAGPGRPAERRRRRRASRSPSSPPTTRSARSSPSPRPRGAGDVPLFVDACASMGRLPLPDGWTRPPAPPTSGAGRPASGVLLGPQGRALAQPVPRRRPGRRAGQRLRERPGRPRRPPRPCRRWSPSATRSTPASSRWSTGSGPRSPRSPTSRWSATRSTGSPTW